MSQDTPQGDKAPNLHKYTVRVSKDAAHAIDAIRKQHGGRPTAICTNVLEQLKDVKPENYHAALAAFSERGKRL